ncbi:MAG: hypothetical protein HYY06_29505 [Deltaproteobacteria bacterium]|nr:hypothetical protein [Deltaproteobacteria bacterium]
MRPRLHDGRADRAPEGPDGAEALERLRWLERRARPGSAVTAVTAAGLVEPGAIDVRAEWPDAPERLARTDRVCHLALLAAYRALGAPAGRERPVAVVYGSALASLTTNVRFYEKIMRRGARLADPKRFPYTSPNAAAGEVAIAFGLTGPNLALTSGFHAGLDAVLTARRLVASGRAPAALAVVADAASEESARWLSGAGLVAQGPAEGAAALLLEPDGARGALCSISEAPFEPAVPATGPCVSLAPAAAMELVRAIRSGLKEPRTFAARCPLGGGEARVIVSPARRS